MSSVGVDIGSYSIKVAVMQNGRMGGKLSHLVTEYNPVGQALPSDTLLEQKLAATIKSVFDTHKIPRDMVSVSLPESLAYTSVISLPYLSDAELASSIHWEAEQHIPVPLDEVNLEYEVLYKPKKGEVGDKMRVLLVAAKRDVVERVVRLFGLAGIEVVGLETVLLSVHRSVGNLLADVPGAAVICHLGAISAEVLVMEGGDLSLTYSIQTGGLALTRALEKGLSLPPSQAEEYKRAYGLNGAQLEGRVRQSLVPVMQLMVAEIRKAIQYYQSVQNRQPVRLLVLSGGGAYLPELASFMAESLSIEVVLAQPNQGIDVASNLTIPQDIASFSAAIGLSMRDEV